VDVVDDRVVGDVDNRERNRIRDRHLYGTHESWNPFAIGYDQRRWRADQSASERADISDGPAAGAIKPQSHHQVGRPRFHSSDRFYNVRVANVVEPCRIL
jgi:hypothetical protein